MRKIYSAPVVDRIELSACERLLTKSIEVDDTATDEDDSREVKEDAWSSGGFGEEW